VTEKRLLSFTGSFKKSLSDPYYSGYIERHFDLTALSKLIKPLYKDVKGITLWVYSPFHDYIKDEVVQPTYEEPIYSTSNSTISDTVFKQLFEGILVPEVIDSPLGAENQIFYSQAVPADVPVDAEGNPDRSAIKFYLMFMIDKESLYQKVYIDKINYSFVKTIWLILLIVVCGFCGVLVLSLVVAVQTSRKIVRSIAAIKDFTKKLTTKSDRIGKKQIIDEFSRGDLFRKISKQYLKMEKAREILQQRHLFNQKAKAEG